MNYVREVNEGMPLACTNEVLAHDGKRLLATHRMFHATEGWLAAENEVLYLCVDLGQRRVTTWPEDVTARFAALSTGAAGPAPGAEAARLVAVARGVALRFEFHRCRHQTPDVQGAGRIVRGAVRLACAGTA